MKIVLESNDLRLEGEFESMKPLFLIWDGSVCRLDPFPKKIDNVIAFFYPQKRGVVAVKMASTVSLGADDRLFMECKGDDVIHVGIIPYRIKFRGRSIARSVVIITTAFLVIMGLAAGFWKKGGKAGISSVGDLQYGSEIAELIKEAKSNRKPFGELDIEKVERGKRLLNEAQKLYSDDDFAASLDRFSEVYRLFEKDVKKPAYYSEASDGLIKSEEGLMTSFLPKIGQTEALIDSRDESKIKEAIKILKDILKVFPTYSSAVRQLEKAYEGLNSIAMQYVMKGDTIYRLKGCKDALGEYQKALAVAEYEEISAYRRAKEGLNQCR
jgi:tetratricopeptide (TPR) repeat protein